MTDGLDTGPVRAACKRERESRTSHRDVGSCCTFAATQLPLAVRVAKSSVQFAPCAIVVDIACFFSSTTHQLACCRL